MKLNSVIEFDWAFAVNGNGTRAIGLTTYWPSLSQTSVDLLSYAGSVGGDVAQIATISATTISDDGKTIIGTATTTQNVTRGFILRIP